ncbi:MAG: hypothetical protein NUV59_00850 [Patescibacteria group bacterium]|nr:hypothetical protein [Patescibacteria group bacterium]
MKESSGVNTVLIVLLIIIVLGGIFWFMRGGVEQEAQDPGIDLNVNLPATDTGASDATQGGSQ